MSTSVMAGSSVSKSVKIFWKAGTIFIMMKTKMPMANMTIHDGVDERAL